LQPPYLPTHPLYCMHGGILGGRYWGDEPVRGGTKGSRGHYFQPIYRTTIFRGFVWVVFYLIRLWFHFFGRKVSDPLHNSHLRFTMITKLNAPHHTRQVATARNSSSSPPSPAPLSVSAGRLIPLTFNHLFLFFVIISCVLQLLHHVSRGGIGHPGKTEFTKY
jgi:hypothetical protein